MRQLQGMHWLVSLLCFLLTLAVSAEPVSPEQTLEKILKWQLSLRERPKDFDELVDLAKHKDQLTETYYQEVARCYRLNEPWKKGQTDSPPPLNYNPFTSAFGWRGFKVGKTRREGNLAVVPFTVEGRSGGEREAELQMKNGNWKLSDVFVRQGGKRVSVLTGLKAIK